MTSARNASRSAVARRTTGPTTTTAGEPQPAAGQVPVLVREAAAGRVDAVTFTAAPAVDALFSTAEELGLHEELLAAFRAGGTPLRHAAE